MKILVATLASAVLAASVSAQETAPPAAPAAMSKPESRHESAVESHIRELHGQLRITSVEEAQWGVVAATMREGAIQTDEAIDKRRILGDAATAVDSLSAYAQIAQAHADGVRKLSTAFATLYSAMPAEQKQLADSVFAHRPGSGKRAGR